MFEGHVHSEVNKCVIFFFSSFAYLIAPGISPTTCANAAVIPPTKWRVLRGSPCFPLKKGCGHLCYGLNCGRPHRWDGESKRVSSLFLTKTRRVLGGPGAAGGVLLAVEGVSVARGGGGGAGSSRWLSRVEPIVLRRLVAKIKNFECPFFAAVRGVAESSSNARHTFPRTLPGTSLPDPLLANNASASMSWLVAVGVHETMAEV